MKYLSFDNQSSSKYSVNRVLSGLANSDHWHYSNTSLFSLSSTSPLPVLAPSSWLVTKKRCSLGYVLKGSSTVLRYPFYVLELVPLLRSPIIPRSRNLFRNICYVFTMPLIEQVQDGNHHFLCSPPSLRSIVISDLVAIILQVSNNPISKNIIFYQLCSGILVHYRFKVKLTHSQC